MVWERDAIGQWFYSDLLIAAPRLEPVLGRFLDAWERSDLNALRARFPAGAEGDALHERVCFEIEKRAWSGALPTPGVPLTEGHEDAHSLNAQLFGVGAVLTTLPLDEGKLRLHWDYRVGRDSWVVEAVDFPPPL